MKGILSKPAVILVVLFLMIFLVVLFRVFQIGSQNRSMPFPTYEEFSKNILPSANVFKDIGSKSIGNQALLSQQLTIQTYDSQTMRVYVSKPEGEGPFPVVAILHDGLSSNTTTRSYSLSIGEAMTQKHQVITVVPDYRNPESPEDEMNDLAATLDSMSSYTEVDKNALLLIGVGRGAHTILQLLTAATNERTKAIDGLFLINPYLDPLAVWSAQRQREDTESQFFPEYHGCTFSASASTTTIEECLQKSVISSESRIAAPMTIVTTTKNERIPKEYVDPVAMLASDEKNLERSEIETENVTGNIFETRESSEEKKLFSLLDEWIEKRKPTWQTIIVSPEENEPVNTESQESLQTVDQTKEGDQEKVSTNTSNPTLPAIGEASP